jgi:hypothetical protein
MYSIYTPLFMSYDNSTLELKHTNGGVIRGNGINAQSGEFAGLQWSRVDFNVWGELATILRNLDDISLGLRLGDDPKFHRWHRGQDINPELSHGQKMEALREMMQPEGNDS